MTKHDPRLTLAQIEEAVKRLPEDLCGRYPEVPWRKIACGKCLSRMALSEGRLSWDFYFNKKECRTAIARKSGRRGEGLRMG